MVGQSEGKAPSPWQLHVTRENESEDELYFLTAAVVEGELDHTQTFGRIFEARERFNDVLSNCV